MAKTAFRPQVKPLAITLLLWGIVALIVMNLLTRFNIFDAAPYQAGTITIIASTLLLIETGAMQLVRGKSKVDALRVIGAIIALVALVGAVLGFFSITIDILSTVQGIVDGALGIFVVIEIFRK